MYDFNSIRWLLPRLMLGLLLTFSALFLNGCSKGPTYAEAVQTFNAERQELERLGKERAAIVAAWDQFVAQQREVEAKLQKVLDANRQRKVNQASSEVRLDEETGR